MDLREIASRYAVDNKFPTASEVVERLFNDTGLNPDTARDRDGVAKSGLPRVGGRLSRAGKTSIPSQAFVDDDGVGKSGLPKSASFRPRSSHRLNPAVFKDEDSEKKGGEVTVRH